MSQYGLVFLLECHKNTINHSTNCTQTILKMKILKINASANKTNSISRNQVDVIISKLMGKYPSAEVIDRDVAYANLPHLNQEFVQAMFQKGNLNDEQKEILNDSDVLIDELHASDILVMGAPMYNFTIPASLKAYFDLIARPGETFNYTNTGSLMGLVKIKMAFVVISSGGTPIGSTMDFSKEYIKTFLKFIGITNVHFIEFDQAGFKYHEKLEEASAKLNLILESKQIQSHNYITINHI